MRVNWAIAICLTLTFCGSTGMAQVRAVAPRGAVARPAATPPAANRSVELANLTANLVVKSSGQINNPAAMNSPLLMTLQQQKQAGDLEAGQIMSAPGGQPGGSTAAARPGVTLAGKGSPMLNPSSKPALGAAAPSTRICMANMTGIWAVNQKKTGIVFTPDSRYNLYTITGCGFGKTPGKIYLQGGNGAFPAHGGKLTLMPVDPIRAWNDGAIIAKLDPSITGELDQDNVTLVVETASGQRGQFNGGRFYAVRGPAFPLKQMPENQSCLSSVSSPNTCSYFYVSGQGGLFASPCHQLWSETVLTDCTVKIYRDGPFADAEGNGGNPRFLDKFKPKLKPGFVISSAVVQISTLREDQGDVLNPFSVKFSGNEVAIAEQPIRKTPPSQDHYFVFYGLTLWVSGPAGISNPLADQ